MTEAPYLILAYYYLDAIENPQQEIALHKTFFFARDITCRIYISEQGINGQMSGSRQDAQAYMDWMHSRAKFKNLWFKVHEHHENVFPRATVKYRKKLVAIDEEVDFSDIGEHLPPEKWKEMLENEQDRVLIDVRNDYEWKIGHFKGAELPPCETFREFKDYADNLKETVDPKKTPVMMYCTGGIRCELYSSILKKRGFDRVYQLEGGVINYGLKKGTDHWLGKLFVFDDRLAVPLDKENATVIGKCLHCNKPNDTYYNCANMDCNELFLCCPDCLAANIGCCCDNCKSAPRLRSYQPCHKPFRRKSSL